MLLTRIGIIASSGASDPAPAEVIAANYNFLSGTPYPDDTTELVVGLDEDGLLDEVVALYLLNSSSDITKKGYNVVDPSDADASFKMVFDGTPIHHAKGLRWQAGQGAGLGIIPRYIGTAFYGGGAYLQDTLAYYIYLNGSSFFSLSFDDGDKVYVGMGASAVGQTGTFSTGWSAGYRESASVVKSYKGTSTPHTTENSTFNGHGTTQIKIWGQNNYLATLYYVVSGVWTGEKHAAFVARVNTYLTNTGATV